jgi:protein involved in polysaccharide export with SLBB domain
MHIMNQMRKLLGQGIAAAAVCFAAVLLAGCQTNEPYFADLPGTPAADRLKNVLQVGDTVNITYEGGLGEQLPPHSETVKDDGTITPPYVGSVVAAGKTPGEVQNVLQQKYNQYYNHLTVTVRADSRYFYISGEVRSPGPKPYPGETDVIKAISAAGDFTDFANKKRVQITRANGKKETVNYFEILKDPVKDRPIYPGDKIFVPRRFL